MADGSSFTSSMMVCASLPDGVSLPKITSASAAPPACPNSQVSRIALARPRHGIETTEPFDSTTATFGFAAATASSTSTCLAGMSSVVRSKPSDS